MSPLLRGQQLSEAAEPEMSVEGRSKNAKFMSRVLKETRAQRMKTRKKTRRQNSLIKRANYLRGKLSAKSSFLEKEKSNEFEDSENDFEDVDHLYQMQN